MTESIRGQNFVINLEVSFGRNRKIVRTGKKNTTTFIGKVQHVTNGRRQKTL